MSSHRLVVSSYRTALCPSFPRLLRQNKRCLVDCLCTSPSAYLFSATRPSLCSLSHHQNHRHKDQFVRRLHATASLYNSPLTTSTLPSTTASTATSTKMSTFTLPDSRQLAYHLSPTPSSGPIVLLSNSLLASYTAWDRVAPVLEAAGYRVLRYDQPGHGSSSTPTPSQLASTTLTSLADDVAHLLSHLSICKLHAWIGVSMGAATGIYFVVRHPDVVDKLVVCDTISCSPGNAGVEDAFGPRVQSAKAAGNLEGQIEGTMERWFGGEWVRADPNGEATRMRTLMRKTSLEGFEACINALRSDEFDLRPLLKDVGRGCGDALCVVGEKDADLPVKMEELRKGIEESLGSHGKGGGREVKLEVIKGAGHVSFIDGFEQYCKVVVEFLQR